MTTIAFIGFGEAGQDISQGLIGEGARVPAAFDILFPDNEKGQRLRDAAMARSMTAAMTPEEALAGADVIISAVTADQSVVAAEGAVPHLSSNQIFMDMNSTSPMKKRKAAAVIEASGARYVESAVMATVPGYAHKVPMLLAGAAAEELVGILSPFGMDVEAVGTEIGEASSIKMFRSVMVKGWEALFVEALSAAELAGVSERVLASLSGSYPGLDWPHLASYHVSRVALHGKRRAAEMREVVVTLEDLGIEPLMATATAERMDRAVESGVREQFPDGPPEDYRILVAAMRDAGKSN
jgi:3-hydroxyisobutyrate dehydrogenase-like beta-hydroxyacid dehydrogenase